MVKVLKEKVLIKPEMIKPSHPDLKVIGTFNPAAVRDEKENIILFVRIIEQLKKPYDNKFCYSPRLVGKNKYKLIIEKFGKNIIEHYSDLDFIFRDGTKRLCFISHLRRIVLDKSGFEIKSIDKKPTFFGTKENGELGVEDPRIVKIDKKYHMTYVSLSRDENISTSLAVSKDLVKWEKKGIIFGEQDKDCVLFSEKIKNNYIGFDRPESNFRFSPPHIWIAYSPDLISWGKLKSLKLGKKGEWDSGRVGAGPPPLKTDRGWLFIYHGVLEPKKKSTTEYIIERMQIKDSIVGKIDLNHSLYCAGAALLDLKNPEKVIAKSQIPILFPMKRHEIGGYEAKRVLFPTGLVLDKDKKNILIYSGSGDRFTTVKKISLKKLYQKLKPL
jgi:beta-1,2-mannobiose phosphorylase / 1,2-beta-oligomannan phosphorylase